MDALLSSLRDLLESGRVQSWDLRPRLVAAIATRLRSKAAQLPRGRLGVYAGPSPIIRRHALTWPTWIITWPPTRKAYIEPLVANLDRIASLILESAINGPMFFADNEVRGLAFRGEERFVYPISCLSSN